MNITKFSYPISTNSTAIIRSKKRGCLGREFQKDMPFELNGHVTVERYNFTIKRLNAVRFYTILGQIISLAPTFIIGLILFSFGQSRKSNYNGTPFYWYIGIILLAVTGLLLIAFLFTMKSKYMRNLIGTVSGLNTQYTNEFGITWTLKIVDHHNRKGHRKTKVWCELNLPNESVGQPVQPQPQVVVDYPYSYPAQNAQYVPMNYYYSTQPQNQNQNQQVNSTTVPVQPYQPQYQYTIPIDENGYPYQQPNNNQNNQNNSNNTNSDCKVNLNKS